MNEKRQGRLPAAHNGPSEGSSDRHEMLLQLEHKITAGMGRFFSYNTDISHTNVTSVKKKKKITDNYFVRSNIHIISLHNRPENQSVE